MHNAAAAEWILSLIVAPDRAASTVGDLVEEASSRGSLWFWSGVLRTAGSHLWHDLTVSPMRTARIAFSGFLTYWFFGFLLATFVTKVSIDILDHLGLGVYYHDGAVISPPPWVYSILRFLLCTAVPFLVGWKAARWSDGREMAAAFAVVALFAALHVLSLYLSAMQVRRIGHPWPGMEHALAANCAQALFILAGAILFRRRRHKVAYSRAWR